MRTATATRATSRSARACSKTSACAPQKSRRGTLTQKLDAVGSVAFNDRDVAVVQARVGGFVERLHARAALDPVRKGQPLAELYVPDWIAAQEEYLAVKRMQGRDRSAGRRPRASACCSPA